MKTPKAADPGMTAAEAAHHTRPAQPPYPNATYAWGVVGLLLLIYTISFIDRQILALLVAPIQRDLGVSDFQFGLLTGTSFALFYTFFGIPFARLADSKSRTAIIAFGVALWSLMTAACGLARSFGALFAARIGVGIGEAALTPAANSMIADYFPPERRGRAVAVYTLGIPIGSALAFLLGGAVIAAVSQGPDYVIPVLGEVRSWQLTFLIVGLPGLLFAAAMLFVREPARRDRVSDQGLGLADTLGYFWSRRMVYLLCFVGIACQSMLGYGTVYFIGALMGRSWGVDPAQVGFLFGAVLLVFGTGGMLAAGALTDRWVSAGRADAHIRILLISVIGGLPFSLLFPLAGGVWLGLPILAIAIFFSNMIWGTAYAGVAAVSPNEVRGQATAVYLFVVNLIGLGVGPPLFGLFSDLYGIAWSYFLMALIASPLSIACLVIARSAFIRQYRAVNSGAAQP